VRNLEGGNNKGIPWPTKAAREGAEFRSREQQIEPTTKANKSIDAIFVSLELVADVYKSHFSHHKFVWVRFNLQYKLYIYTSYKHIKQGEIKKIAVKYWLTM
jgi:hypothetical protein